MKEQISKNQNNIAVLINQNKSLWEEINKLKGINKVDSLNISFDSAIFNNSIKKINFILTYIRDHDKSFSFKYLDLLYRSSRDGDRTETCHKLCDDKKNVLIIIKADSRYIFGGYCKIGFKINNNLEYLIDEKCFLFSYKLMKIYPVIKNNHAICHIEVQYGLCFKDSLVFYDNFMKNKIGNINGGTTCFSGFSQNIK